MSDERKAKGERETGNKGAPLTKGGVIAEAAEGPLAEPVIGLEAEVELYLDGQRRWPEHVFGDPRAFLRGDLVHRTGTSYHLPSGPAVYFDKGGIEVATPVIEIAPGCAARAGRSLWQAMHQVRQDLDAWEQAQGHDARLVGFSTHYNVAFDVPSGDRARTVERIAWLLVHVLPAPVMLLATNRRSTGVGVRPRPRRVEVTVDFTPSPALMIATATLITGLVREVIRWPAYDVARLATEGLPTVEGFSPRPHSSRTGWVANTESYPRNPFAEDVDAPVWRVSDAWRRAAGESRTHLSLRELAAIVFRRFAPAIEAIADPFTLRLMRRIFTGETPSLLELPDRPPEYEDVGRLCLWDDLFPPEVVARSRYERVLIRAIGGHALVLDGDRYVPAGLRGWSEVVFRREGDATEHIFGIDFLVRHLEAWERAAA